MSLVKDMRRVAAAAYGRRGTWAFDAYDAINALYFEGRLPLVWIQWAITGFSRCVGLTGLYAGQTIAAITLHPTLLGSSLETEDPWGIPSDQLGLAYAFDVLLHEAIHVAIETKTVVGPASDRRKTPERRAESSHNDPRWIAHVNRIAPLPGLGYQTTMAQSLLVREGKKVSRKSAGDVSFGAAAGFPHALRRELGDAGYYTDRKRQKHVPELVVTGS